MPMAGPGRAPRRLRRSCALVLAIAAAAASLLLNLLPLSRPPGVERRGASEPEALLNSPEEVAFAVLPRFPSALLLATAAAVTLAALLLLRACARLRSARAEGRAPTPTAAGHCARREIPGNYQSAGVLFFTRDPRGVVDRVLLGVEERRMSREELGFRGSPDAEKLPVLGFPQAAREDWDRGYIDTALRGFAELTADPQGLSKYLQRAATSDAEPPPATWFTNTKTAVIFCEVDPEYSRSDPDVPALVPLRPRWVEADELRNALASSSPVAELQTSFGSYVLSPTARRFLRCGDAAQWLGITRARAQQRRTV
eukprot:TRINITY_DN19464_c0_g1_i1.p1 TRINITY_DN19464_c0_g1~~TRINITY_DN19464_c0_g1_i1.p1  ORF type:complete len:313 (-),score=59.88 TRINITY_DN19464_c0_g1_i1:41-979(-)